jgi:general secretion pathway protein L
VSTLFIRPPARAEGEGALARFALVADGGNLVQQGEGALRGFSDLVASARKVVLLLAAADVTLLQLKMPPLSGARLKAALPGLVEEQVLGDPADCVLVAAPVQAPEGSLRTVAVVQRAFLEPLVKSLLAMGARAVSAVPEQLCLPLQPGNVSAAIGESSITLRHGQYAGLGLAMDSPPALALQTVRALAGDSPLTVYVPAARLGEYQALAAEAGPAIQFEADQWEHWIAGSRSTVLDLVPGLGAAGAKSRDWQRWRWPIRLALLAVVVNLAGLNIEWLRLKREADGLRLAMRQTFAAAYPNQPSSSDPALQMRQNIGRAKAARGQVGPDEFLYLAAALGEAARALPNPPALAALEFRDRALTIKFKPDTIDPAMTEQLKSALAQRSLTLSEASPATWQLRANGGRP